MKRHISTVLSLATVIIVAAIMFQPALAGHEWIFLHHEKQGRNGQPAFEQCMPAESWSGHADHAGDWFLGPYGNSECLASTPTPTLTATPVPTNVPTTIPTEVPTDEPSPTPIDEPGPTPTDEPGCEQDCEPTATPTDEPGPTPTEPVDPTPTDPRPIEPTLVPENTPCPSEEPCGWLFHLIGPNGQEADFASFSPRPDGGWYLPNAQSQFKCLGWVAVSAPYGRPMYASDILRSCEGGACLEPGP